MAQILINGENTYNKKSIWQKAAVKKPIVFLGVNLPFTNWRLVLTVVNCNKSSLRQLFVFKWVGIFTAVTTYFWRNISDTFRSYILLRHCQWQLLFFPPSSCWFFEKVKKTRSSTHHFKDATPLQFVCQAAFRTE